MVSMAASNNRPYQYIGTYKCKKERIYKGHDTMITSEMVSLGENIVSIRYSMIPFRGEGGIGF